MKKWLMVIAAVAISAGAFAADGWMTDFEKAKELAKEQKRHILIDFSGSDWCGWCIKLDKEVFSKQAFKDYAKDNLVLVLADFPRDKSKQSSALQKQNEELSKKFGVRGFPTVFILGPDGETVAKTGYQAGGPEAYVTHVKKLIADVKPEK
ncbi:Disulfide bond reductase DsbH [Pontiella desulfatans]|uniref:Disulfide bond reductase DsbH n=1 Tax=Pontiella desulfatans TaxID=2750659 RepID=A0A6C2U1H4_PONDE|nr:thioredoxin family protein [Pontiella desulfatans]VGO13735.1 Disulfide bond reductase DsbH [Pontiella desulfatans]